MSCLFAFLRGENKNLNLDYIVNVIIKSGLRKEDIQEILSAVRVSYMSNPRFQQLENACEQQGFL